jgi:hypothetical protein
MTESRTLDEILAVHRFVGPYGGLCRSCNGALRAAWHHGTIYSCLHQQDGHNEPCPHGCNQSGGVGR